MLLGTLGVAGPLLVEELKLVVTPRLVAMLAAVVGPLLEVAPVLASPNNLFERFGNTGV